MKIFALGIMLMMVFQSVPLFPEESSFVVAQSGCCKQLDRQGGYWRIIGYDFGQCSALNSEWDGDDIYQPQGNYWWDAAC